MTMELTPELQEKKVFLIEGLKRTYKVQYDAIQPLPYIRDRLYCVDKVFVEGGVEVCLAPVLMRGTGGSWERLESYKSIYTDFRFQSKRRIIQGEPGYGKSTLTLQLAYDWCNGVSDSPMNHVEILILLQLRQLRRVKHLCGAIQSFLLSQEPRVNQHDIEKIIRSCSSVHIILDGYDEYPGRDSNDDDVHRIIKMELFADFDVSLTTRYLPESLREETKRAKLTGFDDKARDEYIRKAVVGNNDEAVEEIKQRLYESSILADLCQVPLIFVMFAHMAHDQRDFMKFKSVTQFFNHMIRCFIDHLKRKFKDIDKKLKFRYHEMKHHELDKIAFEGLNKANQQLSWIKTEFRQRIGPESYDQYISIGILVEEDVVSDDSTGDNFFLTTEVRFYHKLFCEWFAAHHLVTKIVKKARNLKDKLRFLDPFDLQYLFRFACGLDPNAGKKLINHLKRLPGGDTFAILCILEQTGDVNDMMDSVKDLCSRDVKIKRGDSALLQRSTTQLLEIASNNDIPVSILHLEYSSIKFEGDTIILHSGMPLPILPTVAKIHIAGSITEYEDTEPLSRSSPHQCHSKKRTLTEKDVLNLFQYVMKCGRVKELMFEHLQLPTSFSPETFADILKTRNIQVRWRPKDIQFHLDQQNGHWEVDNIDTLRQLCSDTINIKKSDGILKQASTIMFIHIASSHDIPITCLDLKNSFSKTDGGDVILHSGLRLSCPVSVKKVLIETEEGREMTETEVVDILMFVQQSHMLKELEFTGCVLPLSFSSESLPIGMNSRDIKVCCSLLDREVLLNVQSGQWEVKDKESLRQLCSETVVIGDSDQYLQQCLTIIYVQIASYHDIPISCLFLFKSFSKIDAGNLILYSGLRLSCPVSVKKVEIDAEKRREMTETEVVDILMFVQQSHMLKELEFKGCLLPLTFSSDSIPAEMQSRDIKVFWNNYGYSLNLQSGVWRVDDVDTVKRLCTEGVDIDCDDSELLQRCTIKLLENASYHDIPIFCLYLSKSFSKIDAGDVILHSGLRLSCNVSVKKVVIRTEKGREMTETEAVDILMFVKQSHMLEELQFYFCLLPQYIPTESIHSISKSRNVEVIWRIQNKWLELNLQSGRWMNSDTRQEITDTEYNDTVTWFRVEYRDTELLTGCESESETGSESDNEYNK